MRVHFHPDPSEIPLARITIEDCLHNVSDQFALVHLTALRYRQLHKGAALLVSNTDGNKMVVTSLREIATRKVRFREDVGDVMMKARPKLVSQRLGTMAGGDDGADELT